MTSYGVPPDAYVQYLRKRLILMRSSSWNREIENIMIMSELWFLTKG
jgi:hypothetical protein